jgi:phospholipase C
MSNQKAKFVFILMLENHSFDNIFGFSGINGITPASGENSYGGKSYKVTGDAEEAMPADPGHEFADTLEQLLGVNGAAGYQPFNKYPSGIDNSGFVSNFATSYTEDIHSAPHPSIDQYEDVMNCFGNKVKLPAIWELASEFAVCDNWFSSIPGPTWPNRFFAYAASSGSLDDSPSTFEMIKWEGPTGGIVFPKGSIFDHVGKERCRLYQENLSHTSFPIVLGLSGISYSDMNDVSNFAKDLKNNYSYPLTLIEPDYGKISDGTFKGGSSQHPMDGMKAGEDLIKKVYEAIRAVPEIWENSMLIITYDEHGGFYDSVPPPTAIPPGDFDHLGGPYSNNGFLFDRLGVRVPAVVCSPYIPKNTVSNTLFDHTSMLKTVEEILDLPHLTNRDQAANSLNPILSLSAPRTDCPMTLAATVMPQAMAVMPEPLTGEALEAFNQTPLPERGNIYGFLAIANKVDHHLSTGTLVEKEAIAAMYRAISTKGDARNYIESVLAKAKKV